jgi:hypothetical protein
MNKVYAENGNKFPLYALPGGYPLFYLDKDNNVLCADCANENDEFDQPIVEYDIHYEGEPLTCDHCGKEIESAYGVPEE